MRAINHALTGAIIGLSVSEPLIALPLSFLSHYVLDITPHHGVKNSLKWVKSDTFKNLIILDAFLCLILVVILCIKKPINWLSALGCAFLAASPDLFSYNLYRKATTNKKFKPNLYTKFAKGIQWFERPIGAYVEVIYFVAAIYIIKIFIS